MPADITADGTDDVLVTFASKTLGGTRRVIALAGTPGGALEQTEVFFHRLRDDGAVHQSRG
ncbi:MAG: hypothetical protein M5R36_19910 [Deltaproteobacteria bacterium]|nr:hypothetical protein [Deltaproteobacteria bacterium]